MLPSNINQYFDTTQDFYMVCCIQEALENFSRQYKIDYVNTIKIIMLSLVLSYKVD